MFTAADVQGFAADLSAARFEAFPCKMVYRGQTITGASTSIKTTGKLESPGFTFTHDCFARMPLAAAQPVPPQPGDPITLFLPGGPAAGQPMRIAEVLNHPTNPEWRLGLERL